MSELQDKALKIIQTLKEIAANHKRTYPSNIDAVLVFSGPGTYYDRLKPGQIERQRWMDRDRIRAGVAIVREVTANWFAEQTNQTVRLLQGDPL